MKTHFHAANTTQSRLFGFVRRSRSAKSSCWKLILFNSLVIFLPKVWRVLPLSTFIWRWWGVDCPGSHHTSRGSVDVVLVRTTLYPIFVLLDIYCGHSCFYAQYHVPDMRTSGSHLVYQKGTCAITFVSFIVKLAKICSTEMDDCLSINPPFWSPIVEITI